MSSNPNPDYVASANRLIQLYPNEDFTFPHFGNMKHRVQLLAILIEMEYESIKPVRNPRR